MEIKKGFPGYEVYAWFADEPIVQRNPDVVQHLGAVFGSPGSETIYAAIDGRPVGIRQMELLDEWMGKVNVDVVGAEALTRYTREAVALYSAMIVEPGAKYGHFSGLGVDPQYRRRNIARQLAAAGLARFRELSCTGVVVESTGEWSYRVMLRLGFEVLEEIPYEFSDGPHTHYRVMLLTL